jgi:hypothetical protein
MSNLAAEVMLRLPKALAAARRRHGQGRRTAFDTSPPRRYHSAPLPGTRAIQSEPAVPPRSSGTLTPRASSPTMVGRAPEEGHLPGRSWAVP